MNIDQAVNLDDVRRLASQCIPKLLFDFIEGGADDEAGLARNRQAFAQHQIIPRYLVDVSRVDASTVLFGRRYDQPFGISPMGQTGLFRSGADLILARAAARANIPFLLSTVSNATLEEAAQVAPEHTWFQLYGARDPQITCDMVRRARDAGIQTLVLTVDVPVMSNRERNRRNGFHLPVRVTPAMALQLLRHPGWLWAYLQGGGLPNMGNWVPYADAGASAHQVADLFEASVPAAAQTWSILKHIRSLWPGTLVVKGILHPHDARLAKDAGADGIIVSNHGGRQLDCAPAPLTMLPAIRAAVGEPFTLMIDSGVRRGSDIIIARCLGAKFAFAGRPFLHGAAAAGDSGVDKVISLLRDEIAKVLPQMGCASFDALGPQYLSVTEGVIA